MAAADEQTSGNSLDHTKRNVCRAAEPELQAAVGLKGLGYTTLDAMLRCLSADSHKPPGTETAAKQATSSMHHDGFTFEKLRNPTRN